MAKRDKTYPTISSSSWWQLREEFVRRIPSAVTATYLSTVLKMSPDSAQSNVLTQLKLLGLVDVEGKPTERATRWRDIGQYARVCAELCTEIYPQELLEAVPDPITEKTKAFSWFANKTGMGKNAVDKMVRVYSLLVAADDSNRLTEKTPKSKSARKTVTTTTRHQSTPSPAGQNIKQKTQDTQEGEPSLHLNVQLHISPDASAEQIDQIFESMTRHIYKRS